MMQAAHGPGPDALQGTNRKFFIRQWIRAAYRASPVHGQPGGIKFHGPQSDSRAVACSEPAPMKYRIAISGSYGGMNLGDEAILEAILKEIQASGLEVEIVVFSKNPADTEQRHKVHPVAIREIHKDEVLEQLKRLDLLILGG